MEETSGANPSDLLRSSPPPCLIAPPCRVPRVLFEEFECWEEGSAVDLPGIEYLNSTELLFTISGSHEEDGAEEEASCPLLRLSPPVVLEASDVIAVVRPTIDCEDEVANEMEGQDVEEEQEEEEEVYQPISSTSESISDTSNDNPISSASAATPTAAVMPSTPAMVTMEADATTRERHHSNTSTTAAATAVSVPSITKAISSSVSSSRRRKGSSPKKRIFDDPERILDLSAKSSAVDE